MRFSRTRTQVLYRYVPGALFDHDRYGINRVTDVAVTAPNQVNVEGLRAAIQALLNQWRGYGAESFPDPVSEWNEYQIGIPMRVNFEPFPPLVQCSNCGEVQSLADLAQRPLNTAIRCVQCGSGRYRQLPYVVIHGCGKLAQIPVPSCPTHGRRRMRFTDTGRFVTARWACALCDYTRGMPRYTCNCAFTRTVRQEAGEGGADTGYRENDMYVRTNDTSVLYTHSVRIVNLEEEKLSKLRRDTRPTGLLLARLWGLIDENIFDLADRRQAATTKRDSDDQASQLVQQLLRKDPQSPEAKQLAALFGGRNQVPADELIDQVEAALPGTSTTVPNRGLLEHVAILDSLDTIGPAQALENIRQRGDEVGAYDFEAGIRFARETLGIRRVACITDFPIAMASVGYSRVGKSPGEAMLNPYRPEQTSEDRVPIYAITTNTEAILLQLDPERVARWLLRNGLLSGPSPSGEQESWAWIRRQLPGLSTFRSLLDAPQELSIAENMVLHLLHTMSHLFMRQAEWSGFDPESIGEYLIPETLSVIVHSNNYSSFTIGGLVTMFEQRLNGWLRDAFNAAFTCTYNPICEDEGASCAGCLHRQYNCEGFNGYLSRAVLGGGTLVSPEVQVEYGFWTTT